VLLTPGRRWLAHAIALESQQFNHAIAYRAGKFQPQGPRPGGNEVAFGDKIGPVWLHRDAKPLGSNAGGEEWISRA
jgi:hypothetical protein